MGGTYENLIPVGTSWLNDPAARRVCDMMRDAGFDIFFVGGCVRNALLGLPDSDVDMSTNALPETVMAITQASELKAIPTGIDHGTVTVVSDGKPFEITTFRRDVETDGRRAVVAFSDDISEDARRRDFTMNALYAKIDGDVIDPLGGLKDVQARHVRFIEDPDARIREDYLRILRFFRFSAWYADTEDGFDPEALAAISENTSGLETLSAERIGQEITKLLQAPDPCPAIAVMRQTGVLHSVLPGSDDRFLALVVHIESALGVDADWTLRLAALGGDDVPMRLRLSNADRRKYELLIEQGYAGSSIPEYAYRHGADAAQSAAILRGALAEKIPNMSMLETISTASSAVFPIKASDLMPAFQGPDLGKKLKELEARWIASGFSLTREELLGKI